MSATSDPTHEFRFETEKEAMEFCSKHGYSYVIELSEPQYADRPFMCIKREWITKVSEIDN